MICLSLTSASKFVLSTTLNHSPFPAVLSASIKNASAPWVTAVENDATPSILFLCPVLSRKPYTATIGIVSAGGKSVSS